jgi:hypothetical protein
MGWPMTMDVYAIQMSGNGVEKEWDNGRKEFRNVEQEEME